MINKIKAQMYQAVRENATYIVFIVMLLVYVLIDLTGMADEGSSDMNGSLFFVTSADGMPFILNMLTLIYTARTCGGDISDKTMNYELLDGAKRSDVYFSRFIVSLFWSLVTCVLILTLPAAIVSVFTGWGDMLSVGAAAKRVALLAAPIVRMTALYTLLTFLIMDMRVVIAVGFILGQAELIIFMLIQEADSLGIDRKFFDLFSMTAVTRLMDVSNIAFGYKDGKDIYIVKDMMSVSDNASCVGICAVMTAVYLAAGYYIFRKRDIK